MSTETILMQRIKRISKQYHAADKADPEGEEAFNMVFPISSILVDLAMELGVKMDDPVMIAIGKKYFNLTPYAMTEVVPGFSRQSVTPILHLVH